MSSQVVATPVIIINPMLILSISGGLAALGAAVYLAGSVSQALDACALAARDEAARRRLMLDAWRQLRDQIMAAHEEEAAAEAMVETLENRLAAITLGEAAATLNLANPGPVMERPAWLDLAVRGPAPGWDGKQAVEDMAAALNQLKTEPAGVPGAVIDALLAQCDVLSRRIEGGASPDYDEIVNFGKVVDASIRGAREAAKRRREAFEAFSAAAEDLLDKVLYLEALSEHLGSLENTYRNELGTLKDGLSALLTTGEPKPGALELVRERLETLRIAIESAAITEHQYTGLTASLQRNLRAMGYLCEEPFPEQARAGATHYQAAFAIPGGERLCAAVDHHGRLNFEVVHVREAGALAQAPLTAAERALFLQQEARWCADVHKLIRRMAAEGFPFEISLEKTAEAERIRVAVVETGRELMEKEAELSAETDTRRQMRME